MFEAGDILGPYTIVRRLGAGAMGEVYQAQHRHMGRDVAIKVLRAELTEEADVVNRFFTEARATAAVRHPGIVEIFDCDLHRSGRAFIVMEYLQGEDLAHRLAAKGAFAGDWPALRAIGRQLASALAAAHAAGIVHRDLKPGNIFLVAGHGDAGAAPIVKIVDFGIAKLLHRDGSAHSQTQTGHILGTPLYMSPEQARGAKTIDHRTDIYALGCVLFEMLTGRPPFVRKGPAQVIVAHLHEAAPRVSSLDPSVPAALDELVAEMLAKSPDTRPQAMTDVLARLAEPSPKHVATQLLPGGKAEGSGPVVAPLVVATPKAAASKTVLLPPEGPVRGQLAAPTRAGFTGREARVLGRAASTTLGGSAAELAAATEVIAPTHKRPPWVLLGGVAAVVVIGGMGFALTLSGGLATDSSTASARAPAPEPTAAPAPVAPVALPIAIEAKDGGVRQVVLPVVATPPPVAAPKPRRHHAKDGDEFKAIED